MPSRNDKAISMRTPPELLAAIDQARGTRSRSAFVYHFLYEQLLGTPPEPAKRGRPPAKRTHARTPSAARDDGPIVQAWHGLREIAPIGPLDLLPRQIDTVPYTSQRAVRIPSEAAPHHLDCVVVPIGDGLWVLHMGIRDRPDRPGVRDSLRRRLDHIRPRDTTLIGIDEQVAETVPLDRAIARQAVQRARRSGVTVRLERPTLATRNAWRRHPIVAESDPHAPGIRYLLHASPSNPRHRILLPPAETAFTGDAPVPLLRTRLDLWFDQLDAIAGLDMRPAHSVAAAQPVDSALPGWSAPAPNGRMLFRHQRTAVSHILDNDAQVLICDEMGMGKTASAVIGASAWRARRVVVICPSIARSVWSSEIAGWSGDPRVAIVTDSSGRDLNLDAVDWVIASYDQLTPSTESLPLPESTPEPVVERIREVARTKARNGAFPVELDPDENGRLRLKVKPPLACAGEGWHLDALAEIELPGKAGRQLARGLRRLAAPLLKMLRAWQPDLLIVDEGHRVKNPLAYRTRAVRDLRQASAGCIAMTGTPIRNEADDAGALIELVRPDLLEYITEICKATAPDRGDPAQVAITEVLANLMLRRHKRDVLQDLPDKLRTHHPVPLRGETLTRMHEALQRALRAKEDGEILAALTLARKAIGNAKSQPAVELAELALAEPRQVAIFAHHHEVIDAIRDALTRKYDIDVLTGATDNRKRDRLQRRFQAGELQALVVSTSAGGEAITLSAADTAIIAELAWTPAELLQAEDRLHRPSQEADSVTCLYLVGEIDSAANPAHQLDLMNIDRWIAGGACLSFFVTAKPDRGAVTPPTPEPAGRLGGRGERRRPSGAREAADVPGRPACPGHPGTIPGITARGSRSSGTRRRTVVDRTTSHPRGAGIETHNTPRRIRLDDACAAGEPG